MTMTAREFVLSFITRNRDAILANDDFLQEKDSDALAKAVFEKYPGTRWPTMITVNQAIRSVQNLIDRRGNNLG